MKEILKNKLIVLIKGINAGILIGIGASTYLLLASKNEATLGAFTFTSGLIFVCFLNQNLFTGKVGYLFENDNEYKINILIMALGNILGAFIIGLLFSFTFPYLKDGSLDFNNFIDNKIILFNEFDIIKFIKLFLNGLLAGVFVFLAVEAYKRFEHPLLKIIGIILSISSMVLLKAEHSIANVFYYSALNFYYDLNNIPLILFSLLFTMLANSLGSIIVYYLFKGPELLIKKKE